MTKREEQIEKESRQAGRAEYGALLALAVKIIEGLAEQQAMPDDSYLA